MLFGEKGSELANDSFSRAGRSSYDNALSIFEMLTANLLKIVKRKGVIQHERGCQGMFLTILCSRITLSWT